MRGEKGCVEYFFKLKALKGIGDAACKMINLQNFKLMYYLQK